MLSFAMITTAKPVPCIVCGAPSTYFAQDIHDYTSTHRGLLLVTPLSTRPAPEIKPYCEFHFVKGQIVQMATLGHCYGRPSCERVEVFLI